MADIIDNGNDAAELHLNAALSSRAQEGPRYTGKCHYCEEWVMAPQRFCDARCRDAWEREGKLRNIPVED